MSSVDPKRWLEEGGDATDAERDLLRSAGDAEPSDDARAATWAALATRLPIGGGAPPAPPAPPAAPGAGSAGAGGSGTLGAKAIAVALAASAIAVGAFLIMRPPAERASTAPPAPSSTSAGTGTTAAAIVTPAATDTPPATASSSSDPTASPSPTPSVTVTAASPAVPKPRISHGAADAPPVTSGSSASSIDALRDESALVAAARAALRRGDGPGALASLETARIRHPRGVLLQEREVLTIEALAQTGDAQGASRRATSFLRAFPASPHVAHVRTFVR